MFLFCQPRTPDNNRKLLQSMNLAYEITKSKNIFIQHSNSFLILKGISIKQQQKMLEYTVLQCIRHYHNNSKRKVMSNFTIQHLVVCLSDTDTKR